VDVGEAASVGEGSRAGVDVGPDVVAVGAGVPVPGVKATQATVNRMIAQRRNSFLIISVSS
jgi:hypothetical protein